MGVEKKKGWNESPEVTESNLLLKAGRASKSDEVAQSFVQLSFENLNVSKSPWAHTPVLYHSHYEKTFLLTSSWNFSCYSL